MITFFDVVEVKGEMRDKIKESTCWTDLHTAFVIWLETSHQKTTSCFGNIYVAFTLGI